GDRVSSLRVFGMGDDLERKDAIAGVIYPSSLLYFVSGVLEDESDKPLAGMARFYQGDYAKTGFPDIENVRTSALFKKDHAHVWRAWTEGQGRGEDYRRGRNARGNWFILRESQRL